MQSNFYYGNFGKHNRHFHSDLPAYSEHLNHCNNFTAFTEAQTRLYGQRPVIDYSQLPKAAAPVGAADMANVPRALLIEPAKAKR